MAKSKREAEGNWAGQKWWSSAVADPNFIQADPAPLLSAEDRFLGF